MGVRMRAFVKMLVIVTLVVTALILPLYLWQLVDRQSYEEFLLKSVSPMTQKSRNEILQQRRLLP